MMMRVLRILCFSLLLILSYSSLMGQFGLRLKYNNTGFSDWDTPFNSNYNTSGQMMTSGFEGGLDYWFRLKKKRIEFMPEIAYGHYAQNYDRGIVNSLTLSDIHFNLHTHIYALDLGDDCNCPTFSKSGSSIDKGFFIHFTPGISYHNISVENADNITETIVPPSGVSFRAGLGMGLDIGLSDLYTITPIVSYYFRSSMTWESLDDGQDVNTEPTILQLSLRLGFRPDYKRKYKRR